MARKFLTNIDLGLNQLLNSLLHLLGSDPGSPSEGQIWYNSGSHNIKYYNGSAIQTVGTSTATGTVTTVSVASANGFAGSVSNATTTPAITVSTSVTGLLKGNGTAVSAATSGTDYAPATSGTSLLKGNGSGGFSSAVSNTDYASVVSPTFTGTVAMSGATEVTVPAPINASDAATKSYVDATAQGLSVKSAARAATTGAETYTIASGSATQISGTSIDGVSPAVNDYILVKDAPAASGAGSAGSSEPANGLYQVTGNTTNLSVSRASAMSGSNGPAGAFVFVEGGTASASAGYVVSTPGTSSGFTYGTNNIAWTQFSGAGEVTAGTGLSKSGNALSIENSGVLTVPHGGTGAATLTGLVKSNGTSAMTAAVASTDYAPATSGSSILKGNGSGGFASAKYAATIGDGSSTSITVTHSLGTRDVIVQIYDASTYVQYEADVTRTSTSAITLGFTTAPASNSINVVVIG
jgi:hypothetical protein